MAFLKKMDPSATAMVNQKIKKPPGGRSFVYGEALPHTTKGSKQLT